MRSENRATAGGRSGARRDPAAIYLDNAATTWPKPAVVREATVRAMTTYGANPGRGGHRMGLAASEAVFAARETVAGFFGLDNPAGVVFTSNCTMSLNIAIKGLLAGGGCAVVSDLEHNAVMRPLAGLSQRRKAAWQAVRVACDADGAVDADATVAAFEAAITPETRAIICTHASNVFGTRLPIREIGALARSRGLPFVVDAAQSAGILPIDMAVDNIDFLCMPGHKGLYGPMGTGLLLIADGAPPLPPFVEGGTGSRSLELIQPDDLPDRLESGTLNTPGILGLKAGVEFVRAKGVGTIARHEAALAARMYDTLSHVPGVILYTPRPDLAHSAPLLAFNLEGLDSETTGMRLGEHNVAVRAGLHCAPCAHRRFGTLETGVVRAAPGAFTTTAEIDAFCRLVVQIKG